MPRSAVTGGLSSGGSYTGSDGRFIPEVTGTQGDSAVYTRPEDADRAMRAGEGTGVGGLTSGWKGRGDDAAAARMPTPRRHYVNKFTAFVFTEMDKGLRSPYMLAVYFFLSVTLIVKFANAVTRMRENDTMRREALGTGTTLQMDIPFADSHNTLFGISSNPERILMKPEGAANVVRSRNSGRREMLMNDLNPMGGMGAIPDEHLNAIKRDVTGKVMDGGASSLPSKPTNAVPMTSGFTRSIEHGTGLEEIIIEERPPVLIHTEKSEEFVAKVPVMGKDPITGAPALDRLDVEPADIVILEKVEHDAVQGRDNFYRTVQYIFEDDVRRDAAYDRIFHECENDAVLANRKYEAYLREEKRAFLGAADGEEGSAASGSTTPVSFWRAVGSKIGIVSGVANGGTKSPSGASVAAGTRAYLQSMIKEDHIHGQIKCSSVSRGLDGDKKAGGGNGRFGNCVPTFGYLEAETSRKQLLVLPVAHMLRDLNDIYMRKRFTVFKDIQQTALVVGLRSSELVQNLQAFPHIQLDIIERDPALVRIAREFFGLKIPGSTKLTITPDPVQFIQRQAVTKLEGGSVAGSKGTVKMHGSDVGSIAAAVLPQAIHGQNKTSRGYDMVFLDAVDAKGRLPVGYSTLDFVSGVRNIMSGRGVVVLNIPNDDPKYLYNVVQNWRLGFDNQMLLLTHCKSTQNTLLYAFQNEVGRGEATFDSVGGVEEFREVVLSFLRHQRNILRNNMLVDLSLEVSEDTFRILEPGKRYDIAHFLPPNHEALKGSKGYQAAQANMTTSSVPAGASWGTIEDDRRKQDAAGSNSWVSSIFSSKSKAAPPAPASSNTAAGGSWMDYGGAAPNHGKSTVEGSWTGDYQRSTNPLHQGSSRNW